MHTQRSRMWRTRKNRLESEVQTPANYLQLHQRRSRIPELAVRMLPVRLLHRPSAAVSRGDNALGFFLSHFATLGRNLSSARGLFEILYPVLCKEPHKSTLALAISAVALKLFNHWHRGTDDLELSHQQLVVALRRLQQAVDDPVESRNPATALAALILQFHNNLSSVLDLCRSKHTHHDGAIALVHHRGHGITGTLYEKHILNYIRHIEVSRAIRDNQTFCDTNNWLHGHDIAHLNHSSRLDLIGVSISSLQYKSVECSSTSSVSEGDIQALWAAARSVKCQLENWRCNAPYDWVPHKLILRHQYDPPIVAYTNFCDVYPSIQIAAIWNAWRCYKLIALRVRCYCLSNGIKHALDDKVSLLHAIQNVVDSICWSVPFFLGNRISMSTVHDLTDPTIALPSIHDIDDREETAQQHIENGTYMSRTEHFRHVVCQGAWHMLGPLSFLMNYFSRSSVSCNIEVPVEQQHWVQEQLFRAAKILGLRSDFLGSVSNSPFQTFMPGQETYGTDSMREFLYAIRDATKMTGGP